MKIEDKYQVTEGISGYWHYHLSPKSNLSRVLCGARTMHCYLPFDRWGFVGHLNEKYCDECLKIAESKLIEKGE